MISRALLALALTAVTRTALAQQDFSTPQAAVDALVQAAEAHDLDRLDALFGPEYAAFRRSQAVDPGLAELRFQQFTTRIEEFRSLAALDQDSYTLFVGADAWPFSMPIVRSGRAWRFDGAAGVEEMRNRMVGANELNAIAVLDTIAVAQREYELMDHDGDGALEFASRVLSTPGQRDGLYWEYSADEPFNVAPLELLKTVADAVLGERPEGSPFLGYYFRMLYAQGANAPAGAYEYRVNGHMVGGFAMVAWPATYGETGIMSFIVNQDHVIYERDLGAGTAAAVGAISAFDPGEGWVPVADQ
jgi:hypothetical protein